MPIFTGARPNPNFGRITTISDCVNTKYNGLVLQVNRRLSNGPPVSGQLHGSSRDRQRPVVADVHVNANNVLNPFDLGLEEGTSNFEMRHRFIANAIWT